MKKILLLLVCATTLGFITVQAQTNFKFGKSEIKDFTEKIPEIYSPGDNFMYSFYAHKTKYGRQSLCQINKLDKDLNIVATNELQQKELHQLLPFEENLISVTCNTNKSKESILTQWRKFNTNTLAFETPELIDELRISINLDASTKENTLFIRNKKTGNVLLLQEIETSLKQEEKGGRIYALCFNAKGEKLWSNVIILDKGTYLAYGNPSSEVNTTIFNELDSPQNFILTKENDLVISTYSPSKNKHFLNHITNNGESIKTFDLNIEANRKSHLVFHETMQGTIMIIMTNRDVSGTNFKFSYANAVFDIKNNVLSNFSELTLNNSKADRMFSDKEQKKFIKRREKLIDKVKYYPTTFFINNVLDTDSGCIVIGEEVDIHTYSDGGSTPDITKNILYNISFAHINLDGKLTKTEALPRRHFTINDLRKYSKIRVLEQKDKYLLYYLDPSANQGKVKDSYLAWGGKSTKETHLAKISIDKHSHKITKEKPITYPNLDYGIIPYSFKQLEGSTYIGVSLKIRGYKLAPYTFTIE
jgi:hypothetical protein